MVFFNNVILFKYQCAIQKINIFIILEYKTGSNLYSIAKQVPQKISTLMRMDLIV